MIRIALRNHIEEVDVVTSVQLPNRLYYGVVALVLISACVQPDIYLLYPILTSSYFSLYYLFALSLAIINSYYLYKNSNIGLSVITRVI